VLYYLHKKEVSSPKHHGQIGCGNKIHFSLGCDWTDDLEGEDLFLFFTFSIIYILNKLGMIEVLYNHLFIICY